MNTKNLKLERVDIDAIQSGDRIEAHLPCGCIERGIATLEPKPIYHCWYRNKQRMMLCEHGRKRGHIITGLGGFPDGTVFYRAVPDAAVDPSAMDGETDEMTSAAEGSVKCAAHGRRSV